MLRIDLRACRDPRGSVELFALLPFGNCPDVLRVRRAAPREPAHQCRVARDRGGRVKEVRMKGGDARRHLGGQNKRLAETADAIARRIATEIAPPRGSRFAETWKSARTKPRSKDPRRVVMQIFGKVDDRRLDFVVYGMRDSFCRM